jgi:hypothetical protein
MKKNVHRRVGQLPTEERNPNVPVMGIGKISRIHRTYSKHRSRRRSRSRDALSLFRKGLQWFLIGIGVVFAGVLTFMIYNQRNSKITLNDSATLLDETFDIPHPLPTQCVRLAREFFEAPTPAELAKRSRLIHASEQETWNELEKLRALHGAPESYDWSGASLVNGLSMETVMITFQSGHYRVAHLLPDQANVWKVDAESFFGRNSKPWSEITGKESCRTIVRVMATQDFYFNGVFADEKEFICLKLSRPDQDVSLFGYLKYNSTEFLALREIFKSANPAAIMLDISRDAGMEPRQYEIKEVIAQGWVESEVIFQSHFTNLQTFPNQDKEASNAQ